MTKVCVKLYFMQNMIMFCNCEIAEQVSSIPKHKPGPYKSHLHKYDKGLCVGVIFAEYDHVRSAIVE